MTRFALFLCFGVGGCISQPSVSETMDIPACVTGVLKMIPSAVGVGSDGITPDRLLVRYEFRDKGGGIHRNGFELRKKDSHHWQGLLSTSVALEGDPLIAAEEPLRAKCDVPISYEDQYLILAPMLRPVPLN
jgi:hypothetical protein